ncbi:monovalent cation/H+ antiporter subunit A [Rhodopseudomonas palustris]|uniref:Monovalent cation/H+ antiporter subunit A n=1 Tax=Rhodopseudomonas palustris TaxID=1076 RepID=A0A418V1Y7_RHOPL|nr:monovalent cation/H+ antiporter subunit A [Rhodopseudomonas palustris]RJF69932.1 monovalent cation/H+ antiporter subunit A [Rhodopseudomonas palustris]
MPQNVYLLAVLLLPFAGSLLAALLPANARNAEAWLAALVALGCLALLAFLYPGASGAPILHQFAWLPQFGLTFTLRLDGFAWAFACLVTVIGALVVLYARYYMSPSDPVPRFFSFLQGFMGAMLGIVLSGNLIQLVFFWELTSLFSFLLIGYWHHNAAAREGARVALTVTGAGGLCLFAGVIVLGHIVGSYDLGAVLAAGDQIRDHALYVPALILILLGALTKSAQFPFHFWLPRAMTAPTPVSAYLHSATMVKAGVFLLVRLWPVMGNTNEWLWFVGTTGLATFIIGAYLAVFQRDLKGLLAYSTISHLGLITLLIGLDRPLALVAAIFHLFNHATFKASLFMAAGIIDHETGTRDLRRLSGLWKFMPKTGALAIVAASSMAGVPLLNGFLSKEMFFAETIETHDGSMLDDALPYIVTLASMFTVAYSLRFVREVFFGPPPVDLPRVPHEPPRWMRFPVELLVLTCLVVGIVPSLTIGPFLHVAVESVMGTATPYYSLAVWHGLNWPLMMSVIALVGGVLLYMMLRKPLQEGLTSSLFNGRFKTQRIFDRVLVTVSWRWARAIEQVIGTRRLQPQLLLLICVALFGAAWAAIDHGLRLAPVRFDTIDPVLAAVWAVGIACALGGAAVAKFHRLAALILIGGSGLTTCLTFVWFSAPDLALTQIGVEIVTTVLLLLGLRWLPKQIESGEHTAARPLILRTQRLRDMAVAAAAGTGVSLLAYAAMTRAAPNSISEFFVRHAYSDGGGTNVVNVILVDFRGFDTLGEITVLAVVALTVFALLRRFRPAADSVDLPEQQRLQDEHDDALEGRRRGDTAADYLAVPSVIMQLLFPFIFIAAMYLLLRGHDQPGGGFVAGIAMAAALILQYMAGGTRWLEARLRVHPLRWIGSGLLLALATGAAALPFAQPFLTSAFAYANIPWIGKVPLASAALFDLGVFALVVGATTLMLIALAHQSIRGHRQPPGARASTPEAN